MRKSKWCALAIIGLAISVGASQLSAQPGGTLGVYADQAGTSTLINVPLYTPTDFYILGRPNVSNLFGGLHGAEFRVKGVPVSGLLLQPVRSPLATLDLGNPFSDESLPEGSRGGCNIAFPDCQAPDANGFVLLYTVTALDIVGVTDVLLEVDRKDPPSNQFFAPFPLFNACNPIEFTATEVAGLQAMINPTIVSVEDRTWGSVKELFRE